NVGTFIHSNNPTDPRYVSIEEVKQRAADGSYHELLGIAEPKSPATTQAVVARDESGTELQAALGSPENVPAQATELAAQHPGAQIGIERPEDVIAGRQSPQRAEKSEERQYSSTQVNLQGAVASKVLNLASHIPDS